MSIMNSWMRLALAASACALLRSFATRSVKNATKPMMTANTSDAAIKDRLCRYQNLPATYVREWGRRASSG
jgi:hypothetical protein